MAVSPSYRVHRSPWVLKSVRDRSFLQSVCCTIGLGSNPSLYTVNSMLGISSATWDDDGGYLGRVLSGKHDDACLIRTPPDPQMRRSSMLHGGHHISALWRISARPFRIPQVARPPSPKEKLRGQIPRRRHAERQGDDDRRGPTVCPSLQGMSQMNLGPHTRSTEPNSLVWKSAHCSRSLLIEAVGNSTCCIDFPSY